MKEKELQKRERELQKKLSDKADDEIMRISKNPDLSEFQRNLVENEMQRRGL